MTFCLKAVELLHTTEHFFFKYFEHPIQLSTNFLVQRQRSLATKTTRSGFFSSWGPEKGLEGH